MLANLRISVVTIATAGLIFSATITSPFSQVFGRHLNESKDFACCKNNQLVINHYYSVNVFWLKVSEGFTQEKTGKAVVGGCNIRCVDNQ